MKTHITIIGAGMGGTLMAILLAQRGFTVDLYEERPDIRTIPPSSDRSINQSLSLRGIRILEQAGLWPSLRNMTLIEKGRTVHPADAPTFFSPYGRNSTEVAYSFHRTAFIGALLTLADTYPTITIHFALRCVE